ncbi:MAG: IS66 family insertion sequence element accessory protein TnpA [Faecousia sp.]
MGEVLAVRDAYRAQEWAMLIQECSASGLTKREFCRQRGISEKSFYYWLRKLRTQMVGASAPRLVPLESVPAAEDILQIRYRGAELKLPAGVDMDAVAALLRDLQSL